MVHEVVKGELEIRRSLEGLELSFVLPTKESALLQFLCFVIM